MMMIHRFLAMLSLAATLVVSLHAQDGAGGHTPLSLGTESLNFLVISDWGRDGIDDTRKKAPGQVKVAKQLGATAHAISASFVVTCGDNFHGKGVSSVSDPLWGVNFENVYTDTSLMIPWYVTLGNHDYEGNVEAELDYAKTSTRWVQPARYYAFTKELPDSGEVLFLVLDSSPCVSEYVNDPQDRHHIRGQDIAAQVAWCDSVLYASKANWKLAFFHHPAYSASSTHGSTVEIQKLFVPLFERFHVTACFSGHDHDLQHSHPANATVEYFGTGGGSETRPAGHAAFTRFSRASLGFGVVSVTQRALRFSFVSDTGVQLYAYDMRR